MTEQMPTIPDLIENVLLTNWNIQMLGKSKVSELMPAIRHIEKLFGLNFSYAKDDRIIRKILTNSIKKN